MKNIYYLFTFFICLFIFSSCEKEDDHIQGCTDVEAINFDPNATIDDGSCEFPAVLGCTDPIACNYNLDATDDDGSCVYPEENYDCDENFLGVIHTVFAGNMYYDPSNITINVGDQVRWINNGGMHDVNGEINSITNTPFENPESFNSISVSEVGAVIYTHTFNISGVYNYDCSVGGHAQNGMIGTITVLE